MKRHALRLSLAIAAIAILGACSSGAAPSAPPSVSPNAPALGLDGRAFLSTDLQGAVLAPGTRVSLTFRHGHLGASGGCNRMGGTYAIAGDRLTTTQLGMTEMACDEPRMAQDTWLARFLADVRISLTGDTLVLDDGTVRLSLVDSKVANPDRPIEGTRWVVDGISDGQVVSSVPGGVIASIRIGGGRVDLESGCNTGGGTVNVTADTLGFGSIAMTQMACGPEAMAMEAAITRILAQPVRYTVEADVLTLSAGDSGLTLRATP